jgi:hypothetical protein
MHWCTLVHLGLVNLSYCSMYSVSKIWFLCFHEHVQVRGELLSSWFRFVIRLIIIVEAYSLFFLYFIKMFVAHNLRLLAFLMPDEVSVCQKTWALYHQGKLLKEACKFWGCNWFRMSRDSLYLYWIKSWLTSIDAISILLPAYSYINIYL